MFKSLAHQQVYKFDEVLLKKRELKELGRSASIFGETRTVSVSKEDKNLIELKKKLARLPLDPIFGHLLLQSADYKCVHEMLVAVSVLSVENIFYRPSSSGGEGSSSSAESRATAAHRRFFSHEGDIPTLCNVYNAWQREAFYVPPGHNKTKQRKHARQQNTISHGEWCKQNFISGRALERAFNVRQQLRRLCGRSVAEHGLGLDIHSSCAGETVRFHKCIAAGLFWQVATRISADATNDDGKGRSGLVSTSTRGRYKTALGNQVVSIHPTSTMFNRQPPPKCVVYTELVITKKTYIRGATQIREEWLHEVAPHIYGA